MSGNYRLQLEDELNGICTWASLQRDSVPILGDLNLDRRRPDKSEGKLLLDLEVEQELTCLIDKATRTEQKGSITTSTLIDILLTNKLDQFKSGGIYHPSLSDHALIYWTLKEKLPRQPSKVITFRSYKNFDCNKLTWDLSEAPWHVGEILTIWMTKSTTGTLILLMRIFPQRKWGCEQRMCHIWQQIGRTLLELRERHSQLLVHVQGKIRLQLG